MKKIIIALVGLIIVAGIAGIVVMANGKDDDKDSKKASSTTSSTSTSSASKGGYKEVKACDVLTADIGHQVVGADATTSDTSAGNVSTSSVSVTNCTYFSPSTKNSVSILSRSALDKAGAETNNGQFTTGLPTGAVKVSGYGDSAYWSPTYGQFNILKHNNWYILSVGPTKPSDHTQAQAEAYAKLIVNKL